MAWEKDKSNERAAISLANVMIALGEVQKAAVLLKTAIELNKASNYSKYFQLAQLFQGEEAAKYYLLGIEILEKELTQKNDPKELEDARKDLAQSYSALAELYQSDLMEAPNSLEECKQFIDKALAVDPKSLDVLFQLVNFHLNQGNKQEAVPHLFLLCSNLIALETEPSETSDPELYPLDFKIQVAKLLIEVEDFEHSKDLLLKLLDYDEQNPELLYLLSFCYYKLANYPESSNYLSVYFSLKNFQDKELLDAAQEIQLLLKQHTKPLPLLNPSDQITNVFQCEEEDWMDIEEEKEL